MVSRYKYTNLLVKICPNCGSQVLLRKVLKTAKYCCGKCREEFINKKRKFIKSMYVKKSPKKY